MFQVMIFLREMATALNVSPKGAHIAVVGFGNRATEFIGLTEYLDVEEFLEAIDNNVKYKVSYYIFLLHRD